MERGLGEGEVQYRVSRIFLHSRVFFLPHFELEQRQGGRKRKTARVAVALAKAVS